MGPFPRGGLAARRRMNSVLLFVRPRSTTAVDLGLCCQTRSTSMTNPASSPSAEKHHLYTQIVEQFRSMFGVHDRYRPVHSKGILCRGTFTASSDAPSISHALHFQGGE